MASGQKVLPPEWENNSVPKFFYAPRAKKTSMMSPDFPRISGFAGRGEKADDRSGTITRSAQTQNRI
jgi:hypothetical protein